MKRISLILILTLGLLLSGCGAGDDSLQGCQSPPELSILCGGREYTVSSGSYSWNYPSWSGWQGVEACGLHVLDYMNSERAFDRGLSQTAALKFDVEPDSVTLRCWSDACLGDADSYEANYQTVPVSSGSLSLPAQGGWVYELTAVWDNPKGSHGTASYGFYLTGGEAATPDASPEEAAGTAPSPSSLSGPPEMTVTCGGAAYTALSGNYQWESDNGDGTMSRVIACGTHVLDFPYEERGSAIARDGNDSVTLSFGAEPERVKARCWSGEALGDADSYEANFLTVPVTDGVIQLPGDGGWVFEVTAFWDQGSAMYGFYIR